VLVQGKTRYSILGAIGFGRELENIHSTGALQYTVVFASESVRRTLQLVPISAGVNSLRAYLP
jgi:hypothetical protein